MSNQAFFELNTFNFKVLLSNRNLNDRNGNTNQTTGATARIPKRYQKNHNRQDYISRLLLAVSLLLFAIEEYATMPRGEDFKIFTMHYIIALVYVVVLLINGAYGIRKSWNELHIHKTIILINLFLISA